MLARSTASAASSAINRSLGARMGYSAEVESAKRTARAVVLAKEARRMKSELQDDMRESGELPLIVRLEGYFVREETCVGGTNLVIGMLLTFFSVVALIVESFYDSELELSALTSEDRNTFFLTLNVYDIICLVFFVLETSIRAGAVYFFPALAITTARELIPDVVSILSIVGSVIDRSVTASPQNNIGNALRALRLVRLLRLGSMLKISHLYDVIVAVILSSCASLVTLLMTLVLSVTVFGAALYILDTPQPDTPTHIPDAMYLATVTIVQVGYGDKISYTVAARICSIVIMLCGSAVISLPMSVLTAKFSETLRAVWEDGDRLDEERGIIRKYVRPLLQQGPGEWKANIGLFKVSNSKQYNSTGSNEGARMWRADIENVHHLGKRSRTSKDLLAGMRRRGGPELALRKARVKREQEVNRKSATPMPGKVGSLLRFDSPKKSGESDVSGHDLVMTWLTGLERKADLLLLSVFMILFMSLDDAEPHELTEIAEAHPRDTIPVVRAHRELEDRFVRQGEHMKAGATVTSEKSLKGLSSRTVEMESLAKRIQSLDRRERVSFDIETLSDETITELFQTLADTIARIEAEGVRHRVFMATALLRRRATAANSAKKLHRHRLHHAATSTGIIASSIQPAPTTPTPLRPPPSTTKTKEEKGEEKGDGE